MPASGALPRWPRITSHFVVITSRPPASPAITYENLPATDVVACILPGKSAIHGLFALGDAAVRAQRQWYRDEETGDYVHDLSVVVNAPVHKCFTHWTNFESFPQFMSHITRVVRTGENTWHWEADVAGRHIIWEAVTSEFRRNDLIGWVSSSGLQNAGTVQFEPAGVQQCRIKVHLQYDPPYGVFGDFFAERGINDQLHRAVHQDLMDFKHVVEAGEAEQFRKRAA